MPLIIKGVEIKPVDSIKYLGFYLDTYLSGEVHVQEMREKVAKLVAGLSSITGLTWGTPLVHLRKIYMAVLQPQIMYTCSTWYIQGRKGFTGAQRVAEQAIQSIQDQALHRISDAFKRTSQQALEVCLHVPPAELTLAKLAEEACLRIMTSPLRSTLYYILLYRRKWLDNGIGAAVYSSIGQAYKPVGSSDTHTVYAGELEGIDAALEILLQSQPRGDNPHEATIYTDNQAAIRATCQPGRSSGQYIIRRIVRHLGLLRDNRSRWRVRLQWVPGHEGVPGNKKADQLAKLAAVEATRRFAKWWKDQWEYAKHGRHLYRIIKEPTKTVLQLHEGLQRAWSSVLIQLQTGKSALRSFLASVRIEDSPQCQCGLGDQDTAHVLVRCPIHINLRLKTLWKEARETDYRKLLSEPQWVQQSIDFMMWTGLLTQFRHAIPLIITRSQ
ncbi:hypothetical protein TSTA_022890 [Talaromyces stipitatus ATCC 10500]|uniref:RNase H type-1 domain-containing protein n=1 Tax=Talaromyces stipitatus (strain ATCC 10500 / CBS 375.48 / QM 6759 / NRRL 1006) TaxID=441959 RepID=B8MEV2_TALSN|nr:uncharacterized protein TSTA_022890 [Talaromyces stipitatus ATCC 10500]EED17235.1 hypothetical protein TSTA_022890 [Talaromyces stipitatus ATCC 10500]